MPNVSYVQGAMLYTDAAGQYTYNPGDIAWVLACTALVWLMIPGVGYFYSGLLRRKNALSMIMISLLAISVTAVQWMVWGYSLTFSRTGGNFYGDLQFGGLKNVLGQPSGGNPRVPELVYCFYQYAFCAITSAIAFGAGAERSRIGPLIILMFCWSTVVYGPIAYSTWNPNGWSYKQGGLDFAGGGPVHISSGTAAMAISLFLGKRRGYGTDKLSFRPHNTTFVVIGTVFLWVGWFGFNGGSALSANLRAAQACIVTNLAASVSGLTWMLLDYRLEGKFSVVGFCSGAVSGLVAITPGAGFVGAPASLLYGVLAGVFCNLATRLKFTLQFDDALDIFATHAVGGIIGDLLTGIFAQSSVANFDGLTSIQGGWLDGHWVQIAYQIADIAFAFGWSFAVTMALLYVINWIPGCQFRCSEEAEIFGVDDSELGEFAYDYVSLNVHCRPLHEFSVSNNVGSQVKLGEQYGEHVEKAARSAQMGQIL